MKRNILTFTIVATLTLSANADTQRDLIQRGIDKTEQYITAHLWHEAFTKIREVEAQTQGRNDLKYLVTKERFQMYKRINKKSEARESLSGMEQLARAVVSQDIMEDMLLTKAQWSAQQGMTDVSTQCYKEILQLRSTGKDNAGQEETFKQMIKEAKNSGNRHMQQVITTMYTTWQDSIASQRAAAEIKQLKEQYAQVTEDASGKQDTINTQRWWIVLLSVIATALGSALALLILMLSRSIRTTQKLRQSLRISNESSQQKSVFVRNISSQITPTLDKIAQGDKAQENITALRQMLEHVETYMTLEQTREECYEAKDQNVGKLCEQVTESANKSGIEITTDAPKIQFSVNAEAVENLLTALIQEISTAPGTDRISLSFKKRNPHTGQFVITATGMQLDQEQRDTILTAFARVYDLTQTDGLLLPTCAVMAYKMGGELTIDNTFTKGVRFILEVRN